MDLEQIQLALQDEGLAGWLFYDFRKSDSIAYQVLTLPADAFYSRRWFYFIPTQGTPTAIISAVESHVLSSLPGDRRIFRTWQEIRTYLQTILNPGMRVAMEYSPMNAIPYMSRVDGGTLELVRSYGVEVVSSANLAQRFIAQLTPAQVESHRQAGQRLIAAKDALFDELSDNLRAGTAMNEYSVQQRFLALIEQLGLVQADVHVAVNANISNPHYGPTREQHSPIQRGDLVLFDFWAHMPEPKAIYADYTWMAFAGTREEIPHRYLGIFDIVTRARDAAISFVRKQLEAGQRVQGCQVDDVARRVIAGEGYADYFVHRTGHSIDTIIHGNGANIDNFETQDERILLPSTCCSIEPS